MLKTPAKRSYSDLLKNRIKIRALADADLGFRAAVLHECSENTIFWFDNFAWGLDPRRKPGELPFVPYKGKQLEYIEFLDDLIVNPRDVFVDKPRDVGATIMTMNSFLKHFLFDDGFNARVGSRKMEYVDKAGDPDTLFYKIDYTYNRLPFWMRPDGWKEDEHRTFAKLIRPDNDNTIVGESANPNFGRGGRSTIVFYDEIGFWPWAGAAWRAAGESTNIRIGMTTPPPEGKSSYAYSLLSGRAGKVQVFTFDYSDIPHKNTEWFKKQEEAKDPEELEREVLKSYTVALKGSYYKQWLDKAMSEGRINDHVDYNPEYPVDTFWDLGIDDQTAIWFVQTYAGKIFLIDYYANVDEGLEHYAKVLTAKPYIYGTHYAPHDAGHREKSTGKSVALSAKEYKVNGDPLIFTIVEGSGAAGSVIAGINYVRKLFKRMHFNRLKCEGGLEAITAYRKEFDDNNMTYKKSGPKHDWASHGSDALRLMALKYKDRYLKPTGHSTQKTTLEHLKTYAH